MTGKKFFIVGMRRSGTSVLREAVMRFAGDIQNIEFETHVLRYALQCMEIGRYKNLKWAKDEIERFENANIGSDKWYGIKFALNPGVYDMEWVYLHHRFPEARFIFIIRDKEQTFRSYEKLDKNIKRGYAPWDCYSPFFDYMTWQFMDYANRYPEKACIIDYKNLVIDADSELKKICNLLGINQVGTFNAEMKIPENWGNKND